MLSTCRRVTDWEVKGPSEIHDTTGNLHALAHTHSYTSKWQDLDLSSTVNIMQHIHTNLMHIFSVMLFL